MGDAPKVPLAEQVEELANEFTRRCRAYPLLVARGEVRQATADLKIERIAAAHNTLAWLLRNAEQIKEWVAYTMKVTPVEHHAELTIDAPPEVEPPEQEDAGGDLAPPPAD